MKTFLLSCMLVPKFKKMWKKRGEPDHWTMGQLSNQSISSISGMRAPLKNGSRELRHFSCHGRPIIRTSSPRIRCQFRRRFSFLRQRGSFKWKKTKTCVPWTIWRNLKTITSQKDRANVQLFATTPCDNYYLSLASFSRENLDANGRQSWPFRSIRSDWKIYWLRWPLGISCLAFFSGIDLHSAVNYFFIS